MIILGYKEVGIIGMKTNRMISCFIIIIVLGNLIACNIGESKKISVEQEIQVDGLNLNENIAEVDTNLLNNGDFSIGTGSC